MLKFVVCSLLVGYALAEHKGVVILEPAVAGNGVSGEITLEQVSGGVLITGVVNGLKDGKHGFHIHEFGLLSDGCKDAGGHYNPFKKDHGDILAKERHVGDLGNIIAENGVAKVNITDKIIELSGDYSVIGRGIVVHEDADDLGLTNEKDSKTTGHAGNRLACGIIGRSEEGPNKGTITSPVFLITAIAAVSSLLWPRL